jgi:hypothetical protein
MNAKVIKPFFDLSNPSDVYAVGDTFEGTDERVNGLIQKGFLEPMAEKPKPKPKAKKKAAKE